MSYNEPEISNAEGDVIALYEFRLGNTYWRYCTADEDLTVGLDENDDPATWLAVAVLDEGISQGGNDQNELTINLQSNAEVTQLLRNGRPSGKIWVAVRKYHLGDGDEETPIQWVGSVVNASNPDRAMTAIMCRSIAGSYDRNGLRLFWTRMCPHVLYGIGCNNAGSNAKEDHAYPHEIATVNGFGFTVDAYADPAEGTFAGGFMEWDRGDGSFERLGIESHDGNDFVTLGSPTGLEVGMDVTLHPGCARNTTICKLFDNLKNYGGVPHMPGKSPFDGTPVF